jgi:hypothetical protein
MKRPSPSLPARCRLYRIEHGTVSIPAGNLANQGIDLTFGKVPGYPEQLSGPSYLQIPAILARNGNDIAPGLELYFDELVAGAFTGFIELLEIDLPRLQETVTGNSINRIERDRVSADLALQGLHQSEGQIVSYSRIKGEMENRVGLAIRVKNLGLARAPEEAGEEKSGNDSHHFIHGFLSD